MEGFKDKVLELMVRLESAAVAARGMTTRDDMPARVFITDPFLKSLETMLTHKEDAPALPTGAIGLLNGLPLHLSSIMPKGMLALIVNENNQPLQAICDETYKWIKI